MIHIKQLIVRNVPDDLALALKRRAARHGRSAEAEHRQILHDALNDDVGQASFKKFLTSMPDVGSDDEFVFARDYPRSV